MGTRERRERERQARRDAVLTAARGLVRENGFSGTTTKQIAERSELSEGTLFFYFQSKDEIFVSLLFEAIDFTAKGLEIIGAMEAPGEEKLVSLWKFFSEVREEHPEYFYVFTYLAQPKATVAITDEVKRDLAARSGDNFRRLSDLLRGILGKDHYRQTADLMWSAFVGLMVLRDSRDNLGAKPHPDRGELQEQFQLLVRGIAPHLPG